MPRHGNPSIHVVTAIFAALGLPGCGGDGSSDNRPPAAAITSPADATVSIAAGESVTFAGSCDDPDGDSPVTHAWDFGGGATNSTVASPGSVTFATPGSFTVTYTCRDSHGLASAPVSRTVNVMAGWTVLVYVAADNDLEPFAALDLEEMAAGASAGVNLVAQVDRSGEYDDSGVWGIPGWTTAKRFAIGPGSVTELADLGETDSSSPATLADFIAWGLASYPAGRTMLVLWDHGGGWTGYGVDERVAEGSSELGFMTLPDIASGIASGLAAAGVPRLDVVGFDACLMATLEVATALSPHARYLLASEETEPGHGWDYAALSGAAPLDPPSLGARIADGFKAQADSPEWGTGAAITLSLLDLSKIAAVSSAVTNLRAAFGTVPQMTPVAGALGRERAAAISFGSSPDPAASTNLVDIGSLFGAAAELGSAGEELETAVSAAVVYQVTGSSYSGASGLSIYFPPLADYYDPARYDAIDGMDDWRAFLGAYYGVTAVPRFDLENSGFLSQVDSLTFFGALTAGSLAVASNAAFEYGVPGASGDAWLFGDSSPDVTTSGDVDYLVGVWDYTFLYLTQATHAEWGYLSITLNGTQATVAIPFAYYASSTAYPATAFRLITLDLETSSLLSDVYYVVTASGQMGQLTPAPGSALRALVAYLPVSTEWSVEWTEWTTTGAFDATQPIGVELVPLASGEAFFAGLRVENAAGDGDWISTMVDTPPVKP